MHGKPLWSKACSCGDPGPSSRDWAFPDRSPRGINGDVVSRFSRMQFLTLPGVYDYAGPPAGSRHRRRVCGLPPQKV
jgi:hypothetical protein